METFTIRDLRERTGDLARCAESGRLSLVTKRGKPLFVSVPFDDALLQGGVRTAFVLRLVAEGIISQGAAAELLGMSRAELLDLMGEHRIPVADYSVDDLLRELEYLGER